MKDKVARALALSALAVSLVAAVTAGWAAMELAGLRDDVRALGASIERSLPAIPFSTRPPEIEVEP